MRPIGCGDCGQVLFCSSECAALGEQPHDGECGVLSALAESGNTAVLSGVRGLRLFIKLVHRAAEKPQMFAEEVESMAEHYSDADRERRLWLDTMAANINRFVPPARRMAPERLAKLVSRVHTNLYGVVDQAGLQYGSRGSTQGLARSSTTRARPPPASPSWAARGGYTRCDRCARGKR